MANASPLKVLLVAEGSGGHLIPALQIANALAETGAHAKLWYAQRSQMAPLAAALTQASTNGHGSVEVSAIPIERARNVLDRLRQCTRLWSKSQHCFDTFTPDVVIGFGGWVSAPVVLAACLRRADLGGFLRRDRQAKRRHIGCMLHEQNVVMGRTNRLLSRWVDRVAVSFRQTQSAIHGTPSVITGMPVREAIGQSSRTMQAERFGFNAARPTLLVLGGSQGARAINRLLVDIAGQLTKEEREQWQLLHVTGMADESRVKDAYAARGVRSWVASYLVEMDAAYAQADLVIARAGASTIAELARSGKPAILIPYPHAGGHQMANARIVESVGGGVVIEEREATADQLLRFIRLLLPEQQLCAEMGSQISQLAMPDAAYRVTRAIIELTADRKHENGA